MTSRRLPIPSLLLTWLLATTACGDPVAGEPDPEQPAGRTLEQRIPPPGGLRRVEVSAGSFGAWLRQLPLKPGRPMVRLYNGFPKLNQGAHSAVLDVDVGKRNLQQCADAVMRLRAEYLLARHCDDDIAFHFTSGDLASWKAWRSGLRPRVDGDRVAWRQAGPTDDSYESFRRYLDVVFTYAGSASLSRELSSVEDPLQIEIGDVFIQGGFPGHAVLVVDLAADASGNRRFLLAQSYMPAQDIHILRHPDSADSPWYEARREGTLRTPEWTFDYSDLKRFPAPESCPPPDPASDDSASSGHPAPPG